MLKFDEGGNVVGVAGRSGIEAESLAAREERDSGDYVLRNIGPLVSLSSSRIDAFE